MNAGPPQSPEFGNPAVERRGGAAAVGLFPGFDEMEPEQSPDVPRKTGLPRLWQMVRRDLWDDFRAGFLALAGCLPFLLGMFFAVSLHAMPLAPLAGLLGGAAAGPQLCALADTLLRGLRDDPVTGWGAYRKAWRRSARAALLPGALSGALLGVQIFLLLHAGVLQMSLPIAASLALGMALLLGINLYLWPQMALMELSLGQLVKNSALLFVGQLPRTAAALAFLGAYILLSLRFFSLALALLPLTNFWLPALPALSLVYPGLNRAFRIEEKLRNPSGGPDGLSAGPRDPF